mmetsp:Transcript_10537/g.18856  ORF Transcript_10537/g.18856 Transcript_10537/m.18856 type:complete len:122 (-) Transcript_10537:1547-1912(-)
MITLPSSYRKPVTQEKKLASKEKKNERKNIQCTCTGQATVRGVSCVLSVSLTNHISPHKRGIEASKLSSIHDLNNINQKRKPQIPGAPSAEHRNRILERRNFHNKDTARHGKNKTALIWLP